MSLSPHQIEALDAIMAWFKGKDQHFVLAGYAGTGKTTLAKHIAHAIGDENVIFCSYTGKAANVLREKGCVNSGTIHSYLYKRVDDDEDGKPRFKRDYLSAMKSSKLVIVDEYSMLNHEIINDIHALARKVLYLGDPFQLPPVSGKSILEPQHFITEIHRQALDSPIIRAATTVRNGDALQYTNDNEFIYQPKKFFSVDDYLNADQAIVGYNATRQKWNSVFREKRGFNISDPLATHGEKIICLKNSRERGLFNGMIGECCLPEINEAGHYKIGFKSDGIALSEIPVWQGDMRGKKPDVTTPKFLERFDHAGAITCHKSQGSEFDTVLIYNEPVGTEMINRQKWLYTAITRGKKKVMLVEQG